MDCLLFAVAAAGVVVCGVLVMMAERTRALMSVREALGAFAAAPRVPGFTPEERETVLGVFRQRGVVATCAARIAEDLSPETVHLYAGFIESNARVIVATVDGVRWAERAMLAKLLKESANDPGGAAERLLVALALENRHFGAFGADLVPAAQEIVGVCVRAGGFRHPAALCEQAARLAAAARSYSREGWRLGWRERWKRME